MYWFCNMSLIKTNCMNRALAYKKTESYEIKNAEKPKQVNIKKYSFPLPLEKNNKTTKQTSKPNQYKIKMKQHPSPKNNLTKDKRYRKKYPLTEKN